MKIQIHYVIWLGILVGWAALGAAVYFLIKRFRKKELFTREHWIRKVLCGLFVLISLFYWTAFGISFWHINRGDVQYGGVWYGPDEHDKIPRQYTEEFGEYRKALRETPTVRGPEETYRLFREALLREDFEGALGYMSNKERESYSEAFKDKNKIMEWAKMLPEVKDIRKEYNDEIRAQYRFAYNGPVGPKGEKYGGSFEFRKNSDGIWVID